MDRISTSFEGGRGCGKTTAIQNLLFENTEPVFINRIPSPDFEHVPLIKIDKSNSKPHKESLEIHSLWVESFDESGYPMDSVKSENLAEIKFSKICEQLTLEVPIYEEYLRKDREWSVVLDRYLDTVVVYGVAEIIISNPLKYFNEESKRDLIDRLWKKVMTIDPIFPDITFYLLSQKKYKESLARSWQSHNVYGRKYEIDIIQEKTQELIPEVYQYSYEWFKQNLPSRIQYLINIDDKNQKEVFSIVNRLLNGRKLPIYSDKALLHLYGEKIPRNIEELLDTVIESSTGSAFPSKEEVEILGASNCVYNNFALKVYAEKFLGEELVFTSITKDQYGDCPVHWVCLQLSDDGSKGRLLDATPFVHTKKITEWLEIERFSGNRIIIKTDSGRVELFSEDNDISLLLMQLANKIEIENFSKSLYKDGLDLLKRINNDSNRIFWAIRFRRLLLRNQYHEEADLIMKKLVEYYPCSLVIGREIAKDIKEGFMDKSPQNIEYLREVRILIGKKESDIKDIGARRKYLQYYKWIIEVLN